MVAHTGYLIFGRPVTRHVIVPASQAPEAAEEAEAESEGIQAGGDPLAPLTGTDELASL